MKKYNFYAGPAILPKEVLNEASEAVVNLNGSGLSILEISHRSEAFVNIIDKARESSMTFPRTTKFCFSREGPVVNFI